MVILFGLSAEQVAECRGWYSPWWHYEHEADTRDALDLIFSDHFNRDEPGIFAPIRDLLLTRGDYYMHLADLPAYAGRVDHEIHSQHRPFGPILERPHDHRIRNRHLEHCALSSALTPVRLSPSTSQPGPF